MMRRPPWCSALLVLAAVVVLGACGGDTGAGSPGGDDADTTATAAPTAPGTPGRLPVQEELVDAQDVPWRSWRAVDDTTLEFTVTAGTPDCHGVWPDVVESDSEVRVRLRVGRLPGAADRECPAIALESVVPVRLAAPLGERRVAPPG